MSEITEKKIWVVGDRFQSKWDKSIICTLVKIREAGKKPYTVEWDNGRRVHCDESWFDDMKFLEETECNLHNLTSAQELESPKNLLTGIMNTSEEILENGESNLSELRQGIHFVQSQPEVLQQGVQVPERKGRYQFRGSDRNVRVRDDSSESGGTLWGEAENNLEVVQGSGVQIQSCAEHEGQHGKTSKRKAKQQLEGRNDDDERLHLSKMPQSSQSKRTRQVYSAAHSSNGKISGEISGILRPGTLKQRGSSPYQSQQAGQPDREPSIDETLRTRKDPQQREQAQVEQSSEEEGHRKNLCISSRSLTESWNERPSSGNCNQDKHESRRNTLGICQQLNLQLWIYALGWEVVFLLQCCGLENLTSLEPQRLTNTAQASLNCDIQELITTATCKVLPIQEPLGYDQERSTSSQLLPLVPHSPQKAIAGEQPMSETVSPQSLKLLTSTNQNSQQSKTSQVCLLVPTSLEMSAVTSGMFYSSFPPAGTMRTGLLSEAATLALPSLEKEYCWLPSPGALSFSGKGRPPGQTKQEGGLKDLGLLQKGEVLNPDILCEWYGLPPNWLDPSESRAAMELLENNERQQEICLTPELQRSPCVESSILISCPSCQQELLTLNDSVSGSDVGASGCGVCGWIPENFLEESKPQLEAVQKPKGRQRKGCLYKYIENKKLKSGAIASYPRVIGNRNPDNPTHWRWGFNWEEKVDGEWKGRSIGSVPLGAIALIQSMQKEGVSLEEIIGFIRRAKAKK